MSWICSAVSTRDGTEVGRTRGAQSWKQEKCSRTVPSVSRAGQAGLGCLTKPHLQSTLPYTGEQQQKASSPLLQIVPIMCTKALRWAWCWLFLYKNENKGKQKCFFVLMTAARDTCTFAFLLYEPVVQTQATLQRWTQPLICFWEIPVSRKQYEENDNATIHAHCSKISPLWNKTLESHL